MECWGRRVVAAALAAALAAPLALVLAGCGSAVRFGPPPCLPAPLQVTPSAPARGGAITVSSPPASCDLGYSDGHSYSVILAAAAAIEGTPGPRTEPVEAEVAADGSFSIPVAIPADFPRGDAVVIVTGSPYDECGTDGTGSCAGYAATLSLR
ncbi:hypothetical protein [Leifsonia sp. 71-9]|uniref:hypothetical protein n=1 Tax=Leifsonia sp. 71-9 TaxID=1895934 RepID=UPI0025BD86AF|nr:hypothetical protein [Leifsonia sp. 71-9]